MSIMLDAKNARKRAEADVQLLANRLQHLRVAEERARKKICETKARTGEILSLKKRNMEHQQSKMNYQMERELNVSTEQKRITGARTASRKNASDSCVFCVPLSSLLLHGFAAASHTRALPDCARARSRAGKRWLSVPARLRPAPSASRCRR